MSVRRRLEFQPGMEGYSGQAPCELVEKRGERRCGGRGRRAETGFAEQAWRAMQKFDRGTEVEVG